VSRSSLDSALSPRRRPLRAGEAPVWYQVTLPLMQQKHSWTLDWNQLFLLSGAGRTRPRSVRFASGKTFAPPDNIAMQIGVTWTVFVAKT